MLYYSCICLFDYQFLFIIHVFVYWFIYYSCVYSFVYQFIYCSCICVFIDWFIVHVFVCLLINLFMYSFICCNLLIYLIHLILIHPIIHSFIYFFSPDSKKKKRNGRRRSRGVSRPRPKPTCRGWTPTHDSHGGTTRGRTLGGGSWPTMTGVVRRHPLWSIRCRGGDFEMVICFFFLWFFIWFGL